MTQANDTYPHASAHGVTMERILFMFGLDISSRNQMRVLIDINHPAHVHFYRHVVTRLVEEGHEVHVTARNKECEYQLLDAFGISFTDLGRHHAGMVAKAVGMLRIDTRLWAVARRFKPDVLTGIHNTYIAHVSHLVRRPSVIFTDTEHAKLANVLTLPFATAIYTPESFKRDLGPRHRRYAGFHELAYLHPRYFVPEGRDKLGLEPKEPYTVLRCISWDASHDVGHSGFVDLPAAVEELERYGPVLISAESELPRALEDRRIRLPPHMMHSLLHHAALYIGEGATMATEASLLGTPSILLSTLASHCGVFEEQRSRHLMNVPKDQDEALTMAHDILGNPDAKGEWMLRRDAMLVEKEDVVEVVVGALQEHARGAR
jgi:hypothetical protein